VSIKKTPKKENKSVFVIFNYSLKHLAKKDKVRFYYALKGRDGKSGILKEFDIEQLGRAVLFCPKDVETELDNFFKYWKCNVSKKRVILADA